MSLQLSIETYLDDAQVRAQQAELEAKNEKIKEAIEENDKRTEESFDNAMGVMRAGYMVISGLAQTMGGSMSQAFSAMYAIALSGIQLYTTLTPVVAAINPVAAIMMAMSLIASISQLGAVLTGQNELASAVGGLNMSIQGFGSLLDSMDFS